VKVLIAEDDANIRKGLAEILRTEGYVALEAADGTQALELFKAETPDFVCLDIMMPGCSGYDVCREIRKQRATVPIVFISAKSEEIDKVVALELGGDDFIVKPFGVKEVVARIRAVTRRYLASVSPKPSSKTFRLGDLEVLPDELRARRGDTSIELSVREVKLLDLFCRNEGKVLDRNTIFDACWGEQFFPASRTLDQHIVKLRKKIECDPKNPALIRTVHGVGYRYDGS
jgi:two-component system, OmpR family, alkaline phosphatase synthesis response regulator PhoP